MKLDFEGWMGFKLMRRWKKGREDLGKCISGDSKHCEEQSIWELD